MRCGLKRTNYDANKLHAIYIRRGHETCLIYNFHALRYVTCQRINVTNTTSLEQLCLRNKNYR